MMKPLASHLIWIGGLVVCVTVTGCTGASDTSQPPAASQAAPAAPAPGQKVAIGFRSEPDPPRSGNNAIEITVTGPDGSPVTDATVTTVFSMPAMPSMNMPAMRSETPMTHDAGGRYRGDGQLSMSGTWNVTVNVSRGGEELGSRSLSVVAK
jgi:hypothetical protein